MPRTATEIADLIDRLRSYYVAASFGLVLRNDDDVLRLVEAKGYDVGSRITLGRRDGTYHDSLPDLWTAIREVRGNPGYNLDFLGALLMTAVSWAGDDLSGNSYFDRRRNSSSSVTSATPLAMGTRWNFIRGEPRLPAAFGPFVLTDALHGRDGVLFEFMSTGDVADLLEHTAAHLRRLS